MKIVDKSKVESNTEIVSGVDIGSISNALKAIHAFQQLVRTQLKSGHDYGKIPGTEKDTLLKPGAEKIAKLLCCSDKYEIIEKVEDWEKPLFAFQIKCSLVSMKSGVLISEGVGECNSMEGKYRFRWVGEKDIPPGINKTELMCKQKTGKYGKYMLYRMENDDIYSIVNTVLKMAKKRALVDAALSAGRLSDIFTQDLEELNIVIEEPEPEITPPQAKPEGKKSQSSIAENGTPKPEKMTMLQKFNVARLTLGDEAYFEILGAAGYEKAEDIADENMGNKILEEMRQNVKDRNGKS